MTDWLARARQQLAGQRVVVTGASSGIGRAFVTALAPAAIDFVLVARDLERLEQVAAEARRLGSEALVQSVDLRDADAGRAAAEDVLADRVPDLLFANAGISIARSVLACAERPDSITRSAAINYSGAVAHALPMLAAMAERGSGQLVGSSTANARLVIPGWGAYVASKAAWDTWLRTADAELRRRGVPVGTVALPLVATPMSTPTYGRAPRFALTAEQAAALVAKAVVTRAHRVAPAWLKPAELAFTLAPAASARLVGRFSERR